MPSAATFDLAAYWQAWRAAIDRELERLLPPRRPEALREAMQYSLAAGGKRVRPLLALATIESLGHDARPALPAACAIELVHTQSLIHDDLPAMDNDDLRRGKPTNHKVFGEARAILAGDALLAHAFAVLGAELTGHFPPDACLAAVHELADATVAMVGGQVVDIQSEGQPGTPEALEFIHRHKTGALMRASVRLGAILGGATREQAEALDTYADALGLAFQIADDILDVTRTAEELGKTPGKDLSAGKLTFVALYGLEEARARLKTATAAALDPLAAWGPSAEPLRAIARYVAAQDA